MLKPDTKARLKQHIQTRLLTGTTEKTVKIKTPAERAPLEAPPEDPTEGAAGGKIYPTWLYFASKTYDETVNFSTGFY